MTRGDVVAVTLPGDSGKPRPAVVVQSDLFNSTHPSLTLLPLTSEIRSAPQFRITVEPTLSDGLSVVSQIMVDKIVTVRRAKVREPFGRMDDEIMLRVGRASAVWIGLARAASQRRFRTAPRPGRWRRSGCCWPPARGAGPAWS